MSSSISAYILKRIQQRKDEHNFRSLQLITGLTDFSSNDYLGLARSEDLKRCIEAEVQGQQDGVYGSTGSRLLSGNSGYADELEKRIAAFHKGETALVFNSGYTANYGLLSTLPYRGDTIIYDELVHASVHDGIRNSKAGNVAFTHNDVNDLETKLQQAQGLKYVVVESVYSMDGEFAPLQEIAALCKKYEAGLIVDEAHALGIFGNKGEGRVSELGLEQDCLARIYTFGKALGVHGAVVIGSSDLKEFLINYCRPFIYTTALPFHTLASIHCAYEFMEGANDKRASLHALIALFKKQFKAKESYRLIDSNSPIQSIVIGGNELTRKFASQLQAKGFDVRPILSPTVAKGGERIRICLHSFNTEQEVIKLVDTINNV